MRAPSIKTIAVVLVATLLLSACVDMLFKTVDWTKEGIRRVGPMAVWREKAEAGDPEAQYFYGKTFCCGERPLYDNHVAMEWFCKSAKARQRDALYEIGRLYEHAPDYKGFLLPKDDVLAYVYYTYAASYGHVESKGLAASLKQTQTEGQRQDAEMLIKAFPKIACGINMQQYRKTEPVAAQSLNPVKSKKP